MLIKSLWFSLTALHWPGSLITMLVSRAIKIRRLSRILLNFLLSSFFARGYFYSLFVFLVLILLILSSWLQLRFLPVQPWFYYPVPLLYLNTESVYSQVVCWSSTCLVLYIMHWSNCAILYFSFYFNKFHLDVLTLQLYMYRKLQHQSEN